MTDKTDASPPRRTGFRALVGYEMSAWREGYAEIVLDVTPHHINSLGRVHGGVYATILDACMSNAALYCPVPGHGRKCVTLSLATRFLAGVDSGRVTARARLVGVDGRVAHVEGEVVDATERQLVVGQGSFLYFPGSERLEGVPLKPKGT